MTIQAEQKTRTSRGKFYLKMKDDPSISNYDDDIWDLSAACSTLPKSKSVIDFSDYPEGQRDFLKQYMYALMNEVPYLGVKVLKPTTAQTAMNIISKFLTWIEEKKMILPDVTQEDLDSYLYLVAKVQNKNTVQVNRVVASLVRLYEYRAYIDAPNLSFIPWGGHTATKVTNGRRRADSENTTERIPENVTKPLLSWALFYVETVSEEIIRQIQDEPYGVTIDPLTGKPWRRKSDSKGYEKRMSEEEMLRTACRIVILYLTGMRFQEAVSIRRGSVSLLRDGDVPLYNVTARTFKNVSNPAGKEATWVAPAQVAKAISILEQVVPTEYLFSNRRSPDPKYTTSGAIRRSLNWFQNYINRYHANEVREGFPLMEDGKPFWITTRMFRRTLASYIAAEPFGIVAGMMQYKHVQVATFEGYAGTSESGFAVEIRQQQELSRGKDMLHLYEEMKNNEPVIGPGAITLRKDLGLADGATFASESRVQSMLKSKARTLHKGELNDCFYDPEKSLCRAAIKRDAEKILQGEDKPLFGACEPLNCGCSVIDGSKLNAWKVLEDKYETLLAMETVLPIDREKIEYNYEKVRNVITRLEGETE